MCYFVHIMDKELNIANLVGAWISSNEYFLGDKASLESINYSKVHVRKCPYLWFPSKLQVVPLVMPLLMSFTYQEGPPSSVTFAWRLTSPSGFTANYSHLSLRSSPNWARCPSSVHTSYPKGIANSPHNIDFTSSFDVHLSHHIMKSHRRKQSCLKSLMATTVPGK